MPQDGGKLSQIRNLLQQNIPTRNFRSVCFIIRDPIGGIFGQMDFQSLIYSAMTRLIITMDSINNSAIASAIAHSGSEWKEVNGRMTACKADAKAERIVLKAADPDSYCDDYRCMRAFARVLDQCSAKKKYLTTKVIKEIFNSYDLDTVECNYIRTGRLRKPLHRILVSDPVRILQLVEFARLLKMPWVISIEDESWDPSFK